MKTWIFDLDDTLIHTQYQYEDAGMEFARWIRKRLGNKAPLNVEIFEKYEKNGMRIVRESGFRKENLFEAYWATFQEVCEEAGVEPGPNDRRSLKRYSKIAYDGEVWKSTGLVEGAEETLDYLLEKGDELVLMTKGDASLQQPKIEAKKLDRWFAKQHIVSSKSLEDYLVVIGERNKKEVYKVGNSKRSDVHPALKAGIRAVWIPKRTWRYEDDDSPLPRGIIIVLENIRQIMGYYDELP